MDKTKELSYSLAEVKYILNYTDKELVDKIPKKLLEFIEKNYDRNYKVNIDINNPLKEQVISKKTLGIMALIYRDYLCDDKEREEYNALLEKNQREYEEKQMQKYNPNDLFKNNKQQTINPVKEKRNIKVENFPKAYKEVYTILQNIGKSQFELVPNEFINMLERKMDKNYKFEVNNNNFQEQEILLETKTILAYLYINYWGTTETKEIILRKFKQDVLKEEKNKMQYELNNKKENKQNPELKQETQINKKIQSKEETQIVEYKKENIFTKIINKLKSFFKK